MSDAEAQIAALVHEAGGRTTGSSALDGADDDGGSWYADWLVSHSETAGLLGVRPVRSEPADVLVGLDKQFTERTPASPGLSTTGRVLQLFS